MDDFVPTRCAQVKKNIKEEFVSVTFTSHKKKVQQHDIKSAAESEQTEKLSAEEQKRKQEIEMKRLRWDVMKFGSAGSKSGKNQSTKRALIIQLGGKPAKSKKNRNYKGIIQRKMKEKARQERRQVVRKK